MSMLHLRPLLVIRFANSMAGFLIPFIALFAVVEVFALPDHVAEVLLYPAGVAALVLTVRGFRLGVVCRPDSLTIRGYLRNRTIPIGDVLDVFDEMLLVNAIRWRGRGGRVWKTPVLAFSAPAKAGAAFHTHNDEAMLQIQDWVEKH